MKKLRIAINGYGRIGRNLLRAYFQDLADCQCQGGSKKHGFEIVAINDLGDARSLAHLTRFDTTHGRFQIPTALHTEQGQAYLRINQDPILLLQQPNPEDCPWGDLEIDLVVECTGQFRARAQAARHLTAGAKRVLIAAVGFDAVDNTLVYGVNESTWSPEQLVISNASCTTHCIANLLQPLDQAWSIREAMMTEIHAYTSDQVLLDGVHRDLRRGRAAAQNLIPTTSSSIAAVQIVLPQLRGKVEGYSMRVPTVDVAAVDLTLRFESPCSVAAVNQLLAEQARSSKRSLLGYSEEPLVSSDFLRCSESAIFDATQTRVLGELVKITAWYDNEWGYVHRLQDLIDSIADKLAR